MVSLKLVPNTFMNQLVDGMVLTMKVAMYKGVYNVDITEGSSDGERLLKGKGWRDLILKSFGDRLRVLHFIKSVGTCLYVTVYDTRGIEINGEANEGSPNKRCMFVLNEFPQKSQPVRQEYVRHFLLQGEANSTTIRVEDLEWQVNVLFAHDPNTGNLKNAFFTGWTWDFFCKCYDLRGGECVILRSYASGCIDFQIVDPEDTTL